MNEKEITWLEHIKKQEVSGLTIKIYCEQASLNYDQFIYWRRRYRKKACVSVSTCIPVRIKPAVEKTLAICSLVLREGGRLEFHDVAFIKEFLRERV